MNRERLKELGLTDEQIEAVMSSHGSVVNKTKEELATAQAELESYDKQLKERDTQLEELSGKATGNDELKSTIDALKQANEDAKAQHQAELSATKLNYELDQALLLNKARNPRAVKALLDSEVIKLDESGNLTGLQEQITNLVASDPYLFALDGDTPPPTNYTPGAPGKTNTPPVVDPHEAGRLKALERHQKEETK